MTNFDELIGAEPAGAERERLRSVHDLLLAAGPPPEISPELAAGPTLAMTLGRVRRMSHGRGRRYFLVAAAALVALVIGIGVGIPGHGDQYAQALRGTSFAPGATGSVEILSAKGAAKPQLKLDVAGLPATNTAYVVYLVRNGHPLAQCGSFTVSNGERELTKDLVSPVPLERSDTWIVTVPRHGDSPGTTVMKTVT